MMRGAVMPETKLETYSNFIWSGPARGMVQTTGLPLIVSNARRSSISRSKHPSYADIQGHTNGQAFAFHIGIIMKIRMSG